ncbi:MAG TPA: hypothetical protein VNO75_11485 [Gemmatimonadaceae bacterium]|nr:hypothetical protein [Gemmatimonadaceae bacterium]
MTHNARNRLVLRTVAIAGIVAGILSFLGVRPMNSRVVELVLGSASLIAGLALLAVTIRSKRVEGRASLA